MNPFIVNSAFHILRFLFPVTGVAYLVIESQEVFTVRQLTNLTLFFAFFMIANFQMATGRALLRTNKRREGIRAVQIAGIMFMATLFAALDAALDAFFNQYNLSSLGAVGYFLFLLGWLCNSTAVVFAVVSMHQFIDILRNFIQSPISELDATVAGTHQNQTNYS